MIVWLSFCDPARPVGEQFLGCAMVEAPSMLHAVARAHLLGCNPGGEVQGMQASTALTVAPHWINRLLSREEIAEFEADHSARSWAQSPAEA